MNRVDNSRNVANAKCETIGMLLRVGFWVYAAVIAGMVVFGVWMLMQDASCFSVRILDTGNGLAGFAFLGDNFEIDFSRNVLNAAAEESPKLTYAAGYLVTVLICALSCGILWNARNIFRSIDREDTPFTQENAKAIHRIGWLLIAISLVKTWLWPFLCGIAGIGTFCMSVDVNSLVFGAVVICLSHVFAYGAVLQQESDETI
ncbi:MAG: DUF2975 domain-containing protein [Clostridia bacterium]|nr:DUF2975 domain-containing protein [Clostridia bacterium]